MSTKIHWCDETINPVVGCSKISAGCDNCYAEKMALRLSAMGLQQYHNTTTHHGVNKGWNGHTAFVPSELEKPYRWKSPRSIFICSMGDLFHPSVAYGNIDLVMAMITSLPRHTFIVLTKRPHRMADYFKSAKGVGLLQPVANLVLGVSVENQQTANERIPVLLKIPAAKRFISLEPMLGPVDLKNLSAKSGIGLCYFQCLEAVTNRAGLDGVILGGESGNQTRPISPLWVKVISEQCKAAGVPFMFKQWGRNVIHGGNVFGFYNHASGLPIIDGESHTELAWSVRE